MLPPYETPTSWTIEKISGRRGCHYQGRLTNFHRDVLGWPRAFSVTKQRLAHTPFCLESSHPSKYFLKQCLAPPYSVRAYSLPKLFTEGIRWFLPLLWLLAGRLLRTELWLCPCLPGLRHQSHCHCFLAYRHSFKSKNQKKKKICKKPKQCYRQALKGQKEHLWSAIPAGTELTCPRQELLQPWPLWMPCRSCPLWGQLTLVLLFQLNSIFHPEKHSGYDILKVQ